LCWQSLDDRVNIPIDVNRDNVDFEVKHYDLCVTGKALNLMAGTPCYAAHLPRIWIYARVSPSQKV